MNNKEKNRPNIVMILSDDQGAWATHCSGNDELITPNIDRLSREGIRFDNFFCVSPVCSPARASLLTGRIPSYHGIHDWVRKGNIDDPEGNNPWGGKDRPVEYLQGIKGYTDFLTENGYNCGLSGKWHMGDSANKQKGFSYWYVHGFGGGNYFDYLVFENGIMKNEKNYVTVQFTDKALEFLDQQKDSGEPFYLSVHYTAPHSPWGKDQHPEDIWKLYDDCEFKSTPNVPLHPGLQHFFEKDNYDQEKRREYLQGYFTAITAMDYSIGRIINKLEQLDKRNDTIIIFTSDNGMNMGHHGIWGKGNGTFPLNMYDSSIKVPFIISWPGKISQNVVNKNMYSHYDFFPTLLDYLDIENSLADKLPGRSFASLLRGEPDNGRDDVVIYDEYGPVRMVRTKEYKYVHRYPYGPHELYNLIDDHGEEKNLISELEYADICDELRGRLNKWFAKYVDIFKDGAKEPVTGEGQCGSCGLAGDGKWEFYQKQNYAPLVNRYFD